tara:strand:+ start:726 stop:872 length:147 start_codon:yes stop_codon:yes gene_type:complete
MDNKTHWLKYLSPLFGILFSPVTVLFLWSIWSGPVVEPGVESTEKIQQ